MNKQYVKDFYGKIIGSLETDSSDDITAKDVYNKILGYYRKNRNITTDFYGRILGYGDLTSGLIWQEHNKKNG